MQQVKHMEKLGLLRLGKKKKKKGMEEKEVGLEDLQRCLTT